MCQNSSFFYHSYLFLGEGEIKKNLDIETTSKNNRIGKDDTRSSIKISSLSFLSSYNERNWKICLFDVNISDKRKYSFI